MFRLIKSLWHNPWQPQFMTGLVIINILGSIYGYYWYRRQLQETPAYFWPLVPDSPLSTTLFALALLCALLGWRFRVLQAVALTACIKYGIWAAALITHYWAQGGEVRFTEIMLLLSHFGMAAQGMWFLRRMTVPLKGALAAAAWMVLNDAVDYLLNLHPYLFAENQFGFAAAGAVLLTFVLSADMLKRVQKKQIMGLF